MGSSAITSRVEGHIGTISLNAPERHNALSFDMAQVYARELVRLQAAGARAIVVDGGASPSFCSGLDLSLLGSEQLLGETTSSSGSKENSSRETDIANEVDDCEARSRLGFMSMLSCLQEAMTQAEKVPCPVIAAVHGACFGAGIDLITACDIRLCTENARLCVKEVDMAITADMGTLARLPFLVGDGVARELALTAREFDGREAKAIGLVSQCFNSRGEMMKKARDLALVLAQKSPLAVSGTKRVLLNQRGKTVEEGLHEVSLWNAATLVGSKDLKEVFKAKIEKRTPLFSKL